MVEASTPIRSPLIRPCSARRSSTQANTASCTSSGSRERVLEPGVVGHPLGGAEPQELAQGQAVGAAPLEAALAVDALEVADQMHAEVAPGRQRRPAAPARVVGRALALGEAV